MSIFRPTRTVTDPAGRTWEIYVSRRPRRVRVEAAAFFPRRESHRWTTTPDHRDRVVAQVAAAIEAGEQPARPLGATYLGHSNR